MIRRWIRKILERVDAGTVKLLRSTLSKEEWCATIHDGRLYISKGTTVFMCGTCEEIIGHAFPPTPTK